MFGHISSENDGRAVEPLENIGQRKLDYEFELINFCSLISQEAKHTMQRRSAFFVYRIGQQPQGGLTNTAGGWVKITCKEHYILFVCL